MSSFTGVAQETKWGVGVNNVSKIFLGVRGHYDITEAFTVAASFNHYFSYDATGVEGSLTCWDINANLHWNVYHNDLLKFYPFVGDLFECKKLC